MVYLMGEKIPHEDALVKEEEVNEMREENSRLKTLLQQIEKDYKNLQTKMKDVFHQQKSTKNEGLTRIYDTSSDDQDQELVSLRLGTRSTDSKTKENLAKSTSDHSTDGNDVVRGGPSSKNEEEEGGGASKKQQRSGDEEYSQTSAKKARVCVRARCDTPTMNDGCQWRKYGQKIAKGNPCPRAYYRCTVSPTCPVRKQVQRFVEDTSILITTYEGTHNHPLPLSATAMASTTSAAASMLLSGSSTSQPLNLYGQPPPQPYYISNSSNSCPTITLDLIPNNPSTPNTSFNPRIFPSTNLSFSSMDSNTVPSLWGSSASYKHYQNSFLPVKTEQQPSYAGNFNQAPLQQDLTETLTKVISSDPSFRSAIAAVISTMAANGGGGKVGSEDLVSSLKWGDNMAAADLN